MEQSRFIRLMVSVVGLCAIPVLAHHSHSNYETSEYTHLEGTVAEFHWMNPHTWIFLEVPEESGESTIWALEGAAPRSLERDGWSSDDIHVGDHLLVRCHQLKDRSNGCLLGFLTLDGMPEKEFD